MIEARHDLTGEVVTALEVEGNHRYWSDNLLKVFSCPRCTSIAFFVRAKTSHFKHQAHRGENCPDRAKENEYDNSRSESQELEADIKAVHRMLNLVGDSRVIGRIDRTINKWLAAALIGRELLTQRTSAPPTLANTLLPNLLTLIHHPYYSVLLRGFLVLLREKVLFNAMTPISISTMLNERCSNSKLLSHVNRATQGRRLCSAAMDPTSLPTSTKIHRLELVSGPLGVRVLYQGETVDHIKVSSLPCTLLLHTNSREKSIPISVTVCGTSTDQAEEVSAQVGDREWSLHLENVSGAVIFHERIKYDVLDRPLLYITAWSNFVNKPSSKRAIIARPRSGFDPLASGVQVPPPLPHTMNGKSLLSRKVQANEKIAEAIAVPKNSMIQWTIASLIWVTSLILIVVAHC